MKNILHIYDEVYRQNYYYFNAKTYADFAKLISKVFKCEAPIKDVDGVMQVYNNSGHEIYCIWVNKREHDLLSHEVLHAVSYGLRKRGMDLTDSSEEAYAYLIQFVMKKIMDYWKATK